MPPQRMGHVRRHSTGSSSSIPYSESNSDPFRDSNTASQAPSQVHSRAISRESLRQPQDRPEDAITPAYPHATRQPHPLSRNNGTEQQRGVEDDSQLPKINEKPGSIRKPTITKPGLFRRIFHKTKTDQTAPVEETENEKATPTSKAKLEGVTAEPKTKKPGFGRRLYLEYRKNYCPMGPPDLVIPACPSDKDKYCYLKMNRLPIVLCGIFSLCALSAGAWLFIKASPIYAWYAVYAAISELYLFGSFFITIFGKRFDHAKHKKILEEYPITDETAPTVDVYLPVCKEPIEVLENTWKHVEKMTWPEGKMKVFVLDDGGQADVEALAKTFNFEYFCRPNRPELKKAGNLRYAFARTSGRFFAIFDADFTPRADFLLETIPRKMADEKIAVLQTPQFFRSTGNQTWIEQGAGSVQEYFYRLVQPCRNTWGGAICVGSCGVYRREALEAVGGTAPADCSEDVHTGFYAVTRGWKVEYLPIVLSCGVSPDMPRAFFSQQMRWCTGSMSLLTHRDFWKSSLTKKQKACYLTGFLYYSTTAISAFLNPLPAPLLLWTRPDLFKYYNLFFAFPSILLGLFALRWWARARYTLTVQYSQVIMQYAYLHAIWDRFFGTKMVWLPTGDTKAHKNHRYRNMRILAWAWTIIHNGFLISGATYRIMGGMPWYHIVPALFLDAFNFLCVHRFLLYRHPKV